MKWHILLIGYSTVLALTACSPYKCVVSDEVVQQYGNTEFIRYVRANWKKHEKHLVYRGSDEFSRTLNTLYVEELRKLTPADVKRIFGTPSREGDGMPAYYIEVDCDDEKVTVCEIFYFLLTRDGKYVVAVAKLQSGKFLVAAMEKEALKC